MNVDVSRTLIPYSELKVGEVFLTTRKGRTKLGVKLQKPPSTTGAVFLSLEQGGLFLNEVSEQHLPVQHIPGAMLRAPAAASAVLRSGDPQPASGALAVIDGAPLIWLNDDAPTSVNLQTGVIDPQRAVSEGLVYAKWRLSIGTGAAEEVLFRFGV